MLLTSTINVKFHEDSDGLRQRHDTASTTDLETWMLKSKNVKNAKSDKNNKVCKS